MSFKRSNEEVYIIAEIGQNHNGDINIAKKLIDQIDRYTYDEITGDRFNKANAIKLTKRDLSEELSKEGMERPYDGPNSFGPTYGEHREFLELSYEDHVELGNYIKAKGFEFVQTLCSVKTLKLLDMVKVDKIKVASRDLTNIPLIEGLAKRSEDVILSTGMADEKDLATALEIFKLHGKENISVLHCLSQYPAEYSKLNLRTINWLKDNYKEYNIGYSDHSLGTHIPVAAVAMGANIIEKHVTLDRAMKGTDHKGSADMITFHDLVHDIRSLEFSLGKSIINRDPAVKIAKEKLERSLAWKVDVEVGETITEDMFHMISPGNGLKWKDRLTLINQINTNSKKIKNTLV
jgi:sialic acid synthase|tara:strand:+ start:2925 stop:3971 length:1047 start_codon:yes stop_codon:yes gene_type:complete